MADSGATVVIPGNSMPWKCTVNGVTYTYAAGTEVAESSLPAGVLAEIKAYWAAQKAEETGGGTGGGSTGGGDSSGVLTLVLTPTSDAATQSSGATAKLAYSCNMTYAQARAAFTAMKPLTALYLGYGGWHSANSVSLSQAYILMEFPEQLNVYWDATGFYTGEPSTYNPDAEA